MTEEQPTLPLHPCQMIYAAAGLTPPNTGIEGICRITGALSKGVSAEEWLKQKDKFNDHHYLKPGNIISHEALFCFEEQSAMLAQKTGRDKPQRFRTYCHIIDKNGNWHALTKADKKLMYDLICGSAVIVSLTDTGQKHLFFKHRTGFWQLDETHIQPDIDTLARLHSGMMHLLELGFSQTEVKTGNYSSARIVKAGLEVWKAADAKIKAMRKTPIYDFAAWLMYNENNLPQN